MNKGKRAAAIDIGTHSVRMLIGCGGNDGLKGEKRLTITRLGEGLVQTGRLGFDAMRRTAAAVRHYVEIAQQNGVSLPVYCYATSAAREAENGREFLELLQTIDGLVPEIIDGEKEAQLAYQGAASLGEVVMDIGGGSTELSRMDDGAFRSHSVPLGTVTSLERFLDDFDGIGPLLMLAMADRGKAMVDMLCHSVLGSDKVKELVGVGGTATQLAMLFLQLPEYDPQRVHGFRMTIDELDHLQSRLVNMTTQQRMEMSGMHPKRADVIVAGCLIARMVMMQAGAETLVASELDGLDAYLCGKCK